MQGLYSFRLERDELSAQFGEGIPSGSLLFMEGPYGGGKSALCQRFAYGFLESGYSVCYISTELTTKTFINQMYSLNYPIATPMIRKRLLFIPVYPLIGKQKERKSFLSMLMKAEGIFLNHDIIFIDCFSALVKNDLEWNMGVKFLGVLKRLLGMDKTIFLTSDPTQVEDSVVAPFRADSDIYLTLNLSSIADSVVRMISVNRFQNTYNRVSDTISFKIEAGAGLIVEISSVA